MIQGDGGGGCVPGHHGPFRIQIVCLAPCVQAHLSAAEGRAVRIIRIYAFIPVRQGNLRECPFPGPVEDSDVVRIQVSRRIRYKHAELADGHFLPVITTCRAGADGHDGVLLRTVVRAGAAAEGCNRHYKRQTNNEMIEWFIHIYSF